MSHLNVLKHFHQYMLTISLVEKVGYYTPLAMIGSTLAAIGTGLLGTFDPTTTLGVWIGYQILTSAGRGLGFQIPLIAVQNHSTKRENNIVNGLVVFSQYLGGAVFLSVDEIIFSNSLKHFLPIYAPGVDYEVIVAAGASGFRKVLPPAAIPGVVMAYSKSVNRVLYLGAGAAGLSLLFALGMSFKKIQVSKVIIKNAEEDDKLGELRGFENSGQPPRGLRKCVSMAAFCETTALGVASRSRTM